MMIYTNTVTFLDSFEKKGNLQWSYQVQPRMMLVTEDLWGLETGSSQHWRHIQDQEHIKPGRKYSYKDLVKLKY